MEVTGIDAADEPGDYTIPKWRCARRGSQTLSMTRSKTSSVSRMVSLLSHREWADDKLLEERGYFG